MTIASALWPRQQGLITALRADPGIQALGAGVFPAPTTNATLPRITLGDAAEEPPTGPFMRPSRRGPEILDLWAEDRADVHRLYGAVAAALNDRPLPVPGFDHRYGRVRYVTGSADPDEERLWHGVARYEAEYTAWAWAPPEVAPYGTIVHLLDSEVQRTNVSAVLATLGAAGTVEGGAVSVLPVFPSRGRWEMGLTGWLDLGLAPAGLFDAAATVWGAVRFGDLTADEHVFRVGTVGGAMAFALTARPGGAVHVEVTYDNDPGKIEDIVVAGAVLPKQYALVAAEFDAGRSHGDRLRVWIDGLDVGGAASVVGGDGSVDAAGLPMQWGGNGAERAPQYIHAGAVLTESLDADTHGRIALTMRRRGWIVG